jgi:hypothetical protein
MMARRPGTEQRATREVSLDEVGVELLSTPEFILAALHETELHLG